MQKKAAQQRFPWLVRKGEAGKGVEKKHKKFLSFLFRFHNSFHKIQQVDATDQTVIILSQRIEGFDQVHGGDGSPSGDFIDHVISQGKKFSGIQIVGLGLSTVSDDCVNPSAGRREQCDHPIVVPIIDMAEYDSGVFGLNHRKLLSGNLPENGKAGIDDSTWHGIWDMLLYPAENNSARDVGIVPI